MKRKAYHPDVDVYYQENAWADTKVSVEWVQKTLSQSVKDDERFVLFFDNLTAQVSEEFKESVSKRNGVVWYGLSNATDLWQPVDAGYAQILKTLTVKLNEDGWMMTLTQKSGMAKTVPSHQRKDAFLSHTG